MPEFESANRYNTGRFEVSDLKVRNFLMLKLSQFDYNLPEEIIAQEPADPRDSSKLLLADRSTNQISHHHFYNLPELLKSGDILVRNNTKVIRARLHGRKTTGGNVEILLNKPVVHSKNEHVWECLTKPGLRVGQSVNFDNSDLSAVCTASTDYTRLVRFNKTGDEFLQTISKIGKTPLPPYIKNRDNPAKIEKLYQTLYAEAAGSVAAPTAGLHFTPEVEIALSQKGVEILDLTLHVGLGTFLPVKTEDIAKHKMHGEWFDLNQKIATKINRAKLAGRRIIAVGTTTTRVLESCSFFDDAKGKFQLRPAIGETEIFIYPGYKFKIIDGLLTNFHLPKSTLLMLVSSLTTQPNTDEEFKNFQKSLVGRAYLAAIKNSYRFYSFGDAMLIL